MGRIIDKLIHQEVLFTKEECDYLINEHSSFRRSIAKMRNNLLYNSTRRTSYQSTIPWSEKATNIILSKIKKFGIKSLPSEGARLLRYEKGQYFKKHHDSGDPYKHRILSLVIQLSDNYTGGELVFYPPKENEIIADKTIGNVISFKPKLWHEAKPVTEGVRYSIIIWFRLENLEVKNSLI